MNRAHLNCYQTKWKKKTKKKQLEMQKKIWIFLPNNDINLSEQSLVTFLPMCCMVSFCTLIASLQPQQGGRSHTRCILSQSLSGWGVTSPFVTLAITFWPAQCARWWRMESHRHMAVSPAAILARQPRSHLPQSHWRARSLLIRDGDCQLLKYVFPFF